jgi:hypothetical protein
MYLPLLSLDYSIIHLSQDIMYRYVSVSREEGGQVRYIKGVYTRWTKSVEKTAST